MKKIISILIITLLAITLFAATGQGDTTLTLNAAQAGKLYHGFTEADNTTANDVRDEISGALEGDYTVSGINLEGTGAQSIGYYNLYTTGNTQMDVTFTVTPLSLTLGATTYYVPYALGYTSSSGNSTITVAGSGTIGSATVATTTDPGSISGVVLQTTGNGLRWQTLALEATVAGALNQTFGLPETTAGTGQFEGTIVALVEAL
ncbi:MAG: hypothetical protein JXK93_03115 [Sphaerochaetaceae bacterium]|nr:hypothetical protein [Sphaerochaetaceae bacterium]